MRTENGARAAMCESIRTVVDGLRARHAEIARAIYDRIRVAVPGSVDDRDPAYQAGLLAAVNAILSYSLDVIEHGPHSSGSIPAETVAQAHRAARAGISLGTVLRRYIAGHGLLDEVIVEETAHLGLAYNAPALAQIRRTQKALLEELTAAIEDEYNHERERIARSPEQRRLEFVRRLLNREPVGDSELADLRYNFDAWHIGIVATGRSAGKALESLTEGLECLRVLAGEEVVWGWSGGRQELSHADLERRCALSKSDVLIAFGEPARGIEGWRETHEQARHALRVAVLTEQSPIRYVDMALLVPWLEDPERGRALVDLYLSPLDRQRDRGAMSLQTLHAYHEAGWNVGSAARELGIERRSVAYRLEKIEECLGYKLDIRKAELAVVLRLHRLQKR